METYDVIVIGGGSAAFEAAIAAREGGAERVVMLEKAPESEYGGNARFSGTGFRFWHAGAQEIREFVAYFRWADANVRPQGTTQPQPAAPGTALPPSQTLSAPGPGNTLESRSTTEKSGGAGAKGSSK